MPVSITICFRIILAYFLISVLIHPAFASESDLSISSETIVRFFEREKENEEKFKVLPVYEYLEIDYGDTELGGISFHINGWGRADLGDQEYYKNDTDGYILNGYIQYSNLKNGLDVKLGRQHIFSGIINDSVDAVAVKSYAGSNISIFAFGGCPVGYEDTDGRTGDIAFGGRTSLQHIFPGELGLSYKKLENNSETIENKTGVDVSLYLFDRFSFSGVSIWNLETENWGEHSYSTSFYINQFTLKADYQMFQYEDYFSDKPSSALNYLIDTDETLTVIGGDIVWQKFQEVDVGLKLDHYTYDLRQETSRYLALVLNIYGQSQTSAGGEMGIMDGESKENRYYQGRIYFYWDTPTGLLDNSFLDGELLYVHYENKIFGKDSSFFASAGCGRKIFDDTLVLKFSGDFSSDPYHDSDIRFKTIIQIEY